MDQWCFQWSYSSCFKLSYILHRYCYVVVVVVVFAFVVVVVVVFAFVVVVVIVAVVGVVFFTVDQRDGMILWWTYICLGVLHVFNLCFGTDYSISDSNLCVHVAHHLV